MADREPGLWFKVYPFCSAAHHAADAILKLKAEHGLTFGQTERIDVIYPPGGDAALTEQRPKTGEAGRFSVEYVITLALHGKDFSVEHFTSEPIPESLQKDLSGFTVAAMTKFSQLTTPFRRAVLQLYGSRLPAVMSMKHVSTVRRERRETVFLKRH